MTTQDTITMRKSTMNWRANHMDDYRDYQANYHRAYYESHKATHRHRTFLRMLVNRIVNKNVSERNEIRCMEEMGCSVSDFKRHIEKQFKSHMRWSNYGKVWHFDHIFPLATDFQAACHFSNIRPMAPSKNKKKLKEDLRILKSNPNYKGGKMKKAREKRNALVMELKMMDYISQGDSIYSMSEQELKDFAKRYEEITKLLEENN